MKTLKSFLLLILIFNAFLSYSQLKVETDGRIIFGNNKTASTGMSILDQNTRSNSEPFRIIRTADDRITFSRYGSYGMSIQTSGEVILGSGAANNTSITYVPLRVFGTSPGGINLSMRSGGSSIAFKVEVDESYTTPIASYFNNNKTFYVNANGQVYSNGSLLTSDLSLKNNIETISSPLDKVLQLRGVIYNLNFPVEESKSISLEKAFESSKLTTPNLTFELFKQIESEKKRKRMGVIAQEVEKVVPEVVRTREDGLKAVSYSELVGLLIEALKEQQIMIDDLKQEMELLKGKNIIGKSAVSTVESLVKEIITEDKLLSQCYLYQNTPNPFQVKTEIRYSLPAGINSAEIYIFNMQGVLMKRIQADASGIVELRASDLSAGMYLYTLVVQGKEIDTKRMILTQ